MWLDLSEIKATLRATYIFDLVLSLQALIHEPVHYEDVFQGGEKSENGNADPNDNCIAQQLQDSGPRQKKTRVALVFGREDLGLSDAEVEACDVACSIPIGRLQESLSLGHAVSIVLSGLYAQRLSFVASSHDKNPAMNSYLVHSPEGLAEGYDRDAGMEQ